MSNSVDPDETAHYEQSQPGLCCLHLVVKEFFCSERVKANCSFFKGYVCRDMFTLPFAVIGNPCSVIGAIPRLILCQYVQS